VSKVALQGCQREVVAYLNPLQVGVASPAGMDFANAFNLVDREALFQQVCIIAPSIACWVEFCYNAEPLLFLSDCTIKSSMGVQFFVSSASA
jgi:hypothetical protein